MPESEYIDAELESLLREAAADPRSRLLRVERTVDLRGLFERSPVVTVAAAGLTKPERHLIEAHRRELAFTLRVACFNRFLGDPKLHQWVGRFHTVDRRLEPTDMMRWQELARSELAVPSSDPAVCDGAEVLERCVATSVFHDADISQLAAASIRLEPTDQARLFVVFDLIMKDQAAVAMRILKDVLAGLPSDEHASRAWQLVALCFSRMNRFGQAAEAARNSEHLGDVRPGPFLNACYYALMGHDRRHVLEVSSRLPDVMPREHRSITEFVQRLASKRQAGVCVVDARTREFITTVVDELGTTARKIADVLI
jgi:hypothetical protein